MGFAEAVRICLSKYVDFSGRARRSEYWWFALLAFIVSVVGVVIDRALGTSFVQLLLGLALFLPGLAVSVRRLHDRDRSGWMILLALIPLVGGIILLVFYVQDGTPGANKYGPSPKGLGSEPMAYGSAPI